MTHEGLMLRYVSWVRNPGTTSGTGRNVPNAPLIVHHLRRLLVPEPHPIHVHVRLGRPVEVLEVLTAPMEPLSMRHRRLGHCLIGIP